MTGTPSPAPPPPCFRYCECFQGGIPCTEKCRCLDCKNYSDSTIRAAEGLEGGGGLGLVGLSSDGFPVPGMKAQLEAPPGTGMGMGMGMGSGAGVGAGADCPEETMLFNCSTISSLSTLTRFSEYNVSFS